MKTRHLEGPGIGRERRAARDNAEWVRDLRADGAVQATALQDLREGMLRVIRTCLARWGAQLDGESLAQDCAQDALMAVLKHLDTFRGDSRFTTWAYQIAIRQALGALRQRHWRFRSLEAAPGRDDPATVPLESPDPDPERRLQQGHVWQVLREIIDHGLTARQREVLDAAVFRGMPLDLLAESLGTSRDNIYKILHDARRSVRRHLLERQLTQDELLDPFRERG